MEKRGEPGNEARGHRVCVKIWSGDETSCPQFSGRNGCTFQHVQSVLAHETTQGPTGNPMSMSFLWLSANVGVLSYIGKEEQSIRTVS